MQLLQGQALFDSKGDDVLRPAHPHDKIIRVLSLIASGMGQNAVCRQEDVTGDSVRDWIVLASKQVSAFTA